MSSELLLGDSADAADRQQSLLKKCDEFALTVNIGGMSSLNSRYSESAHEASSNSHYGHAARLETKAVKVSSGFEPAVYDELVNQERVEKAQRQIWGVFVVYLSHFCGIHPIRAPYYCNATKCKRLNLWHRLSWFNIFICTSNLLVSVNHIYLRFFSDDSHSLWSTKDKAQWIQTFVASLTPPLIIVASMWASPALDRLMQLISYEKLDISQSKNQKRIQRWFNIMFWLNFMFAFVVVAQLVQIIFMDFVSYNVQRQSKDSQPSLDADFISMQDPLKFRTKRFLVMLDVCYFNIMCFVVIVCDSSFWIYQRITETFNFKPVFVKIPQVIIMKTAIELSVMFVENTECVSRKKLSKECLIDFFNQFRRLEAINSQLETTYSTIILIVILCKLTIGTVKTYALIRYLTTETGGLSIARFVFNHGQTGNSDDDQHRLQRKHDDVYMHALEFSFTLLGIVLNFIWTMGFVLSLVYCNDTSRSSTSILLNKLVDDKAKSIKDQILQKLNNNDWGISMGKFKRVDRPAVVTMISLVFTVVAVWLQLGTNQFK